MKAQVLALAVLAGACAQEADQDASRQEPAQSVPAGPEEAASAPSKRALIPVVFHGRWDASAAACATGSDRKLAVAADQLVLHDAIGTPTSVTPRGPDAIQVDADFSGQGETWQASVEFSLASDTLTISEPDGKSSRVRCL